MSLIKLLALVLLLVTTKSFSADFNASSFGSSSGDSGSSSSETNDGEGFMEQIFAGQWNSCVEWGIRGCCAWPCTKFVVNHYLPVLYIEVINSPGDSTDSGSSGIISGASSLMSGDSDSDSGSSDTGSIGEMASGAVDSFLDFINNTRSTGADKNFEIKIWDISKIAADQVADRMVCMSCELKYAEMAKNSQTVSDQSKSNDSSSSSGQDCGVSDCSLTEYFEEDDDEDTHLVYDSAKDTDNWHYGCRDMPSLSDTDDNTGAASTNNDSSGSSGSSGINTNSSNGAIGTGTSGGVADAASALMRCSAPSSGGLFGGGPLGGDGEDEECVGVWGTLKPRQMKSHTPDIVAAAYAAYRALHIARYTLGTTGWPVDTKGGGFFQHTYPNPGGCFLPGANTADVDTVGASSDGRYSFAWWINVSCCKSFSDIGQCFGEDSEDSEDSGDSGDSGGSSGSSSGGLSSSLGGFSGECSSSSSSSGQ